MNLLDGKQVKDFLLNTLINEKEINLSVIQIGNNPESNIYINTKKKILNQLNINVDIIKYEDSTLEENIIAKIEELNNDDKVDGILVELPIPDNYDSRKIINTIIESKDVDGLTDKNLNKLKNNEKCLVSPTALSVLEILDYYHVDLNNKEIVILGRSNLVGKPLSYLFLNRGLNVTVCHSKTENVKDITRKADVLISAVGKPNLVTSDMVKDKVVIVDVGINKLDDKIVGDVDFDGVKAKTSFITPVPGGIGQVVSLMLAKNIIKKQSDV